VPGSQNDVCIHACAVHLLDTIIIDSTMAGSIFQCPNKNKNKNIIFYFEESMSLNRIFQKYSKLLSIFNHYFIFSLNNKCFPKIICISENNNTISVKASCQVVFLVFPQILPIFQSEIWELLGIF
jgi:hypothetical protein